MLLALLCSMTMAASPSLAATSASEAVGDKNLATLRAWLQGDWGNMDQFFFQDRIGVPSAERRPLALVTLRDAPLPEDGSPASWLRLSVQGSSESSDFLLVHAAAPGAEIVSVVRRIRPKAAASAPSTPAPRTVAIVPTQWSADEATCQIRWRLSASTFVGVQTGEGCPAWPGAQAAAGQTRVVISADDLWIEPADPTGAQPNHPYVRELRLRRANWFTCRINDILPGGGTMQFGQLRVREFETWTGLRVHDQGGEAWVTPRGQPARRIGLRLHNVVWPFGDSGAARGLYLLDAAQPDDGRGTAYASSAPDSRRLALSNRDFSVSCFMDPL